MIFELVGLGMIATILVVQAATRLTDRILQREHELDLADLRDDEDDGGAAIDFHISPFQPWVADRSICPKCGAVEHSRRDDEDEREDAGPCPPFACPTADDCSPLPHLHVQCASCDSEWLMAPADAERFKTDT